MPRFQLYFLLTTLAVIAVVKPEETTDNLGDLDDSDPQPGKPGNYRLVVHLHRTLRLNVFGKRIDGALKIKVTTNGVDATQEIGLKEGVLGNMIIKRTKISISGDLDETSTVSLSYDGQGDGILQVWRVALIPTEGTVVTNARKSVCASFKGNNLLEVQGSIQKTLSRKACLGLPGAK